MNFQVIIPVVNIEMFNILLNNILENTILPSKIIIINNSFEPINCFHQTKTSSEIEFILVTPSNSLPVNESWNLGISHLSKCDFVSILNDDIEIPRTFFERVLKGFNSHSDAGSICPCTVTNKSQLEEFLLVDRFDKMKRKEGWAFTIRKSILDKIPPIHPELKMFFGDDWFWWYIYRGGSGCFWYKDCGTVIFHKVGTALRKIDKSKRAQIKKDERKIWYDLKNKLIEGETFSKT